MRLLTIFLVLLIGGCNTVAIDESCPADQYKTTRVVAVYECRGRNDSRVYKLENGKVVPCDYKMVHFCRKRTQKETP